MKYAFALLLLIPFQLMAQRAGDRLNLGDLVLEALRNNPELKAAQLNRDLLEERVNQAGVLENPELVYIHEEMPGFRWNESMMRKIGIVQMFPFPGKLSTQNEIADIQAEHAHHDQIEKANEILSNLRSAYFELWYAQQSIALNRESARLLQQVSKIAQIRYGVGETPQQDVLKSFVEIAKLDNQLLSLGQQKKAARAMLVSLLNRPPDDTLGTAFVPDSVVFTPTLDTLQQLALRFRGMLVHDSLMIEENRAMLSLAKKEYLPDFKVGLEYETRTDIDFRGWNVSVGVTLPFMPWTVARANSKVEEASISVEKARETLNSSRNMVRANISELYFKAQSLKQQLENYSTVIVPQTRQALQASTLAYQTGKTDYLALIDSYRMLVDLSMEKLMLRMQLEQTIAELKRVVGYAAIFETEDKGN